MTIASGHISVNPGQSDDLQAHLKAAGATLDQEADPASTGPASFMVTDPDGNPILVDQHR